MNRRQQTLAKSAAVQALRIRASVHVKPWDAIDIFDLTQQLGVEVRFAKISSMEGMYLRQSAPTILIASERPAGRQRFSCAHELGHHCHQKPYGKEGTLPFEWPPTRSVPGVFP
jgi:Zn-dependent peptidase ImmA (M78 family)